MERSRREAAEREETERALEAADRAAQDRMRERERAYNDMDQAHRDIDEWHRQIEDIGMKLSTVTDGKQAAAYEAEIRQLNEQIDGNHQWIEDIQNYVYTLDEDDRRHQEYLDDVSRQEQERQMEAAQARIDGLQGEKDALTALRTTLEEAKAEWNRYTNTDTTQLPDDWTQEKVDDLEAAYFDLEKEARELQKSVDEVQGLKDAADAIIA
jgi:predicted  nucleic acid-binding Zn-ribbon protein